MVRKPPSELNIVLYFNNNETRANFVTSKMHVRFPQVSKTVVHSKVAVM